MKHLLVALLAIAPVSAHAQGRVFSADIGLGVAVAPTYPGSDETEAAPWLLWRNAGWSRPGTSGVRADGFSISPSFGVVGERSVDDDQSLAGLETIDRAYELGARFSYASGPVTGYASLRKGFGGHDGLTGEVGVKYRTDASDRLSLWSGLEAGYGDGDYNLTYFGVSTADAAGSGYPAYDLGGGVNKVAAKLEARYAINDNTALLGEVEYGRIVGDAADSPLVQDRDQPAVRLGIVRNFSFGF
ncbi:MipA/OmpV family protein [Paracoccus tegillarcae]|uniref:MipA/OmpV family protein n=1 Tax=Paracoccus tegillarcae TaxID=1529068 RepID=A0A2K9EJM3_9RHOB|nr:MipA/OmpV family protein [Paracoccus tegillarcae]AUH34589.1 MipA/OmpV family protein [Paracoccus tegillarcae]